MDGFIHQFLAGLTTGEIYGSIALALVMIHQSTHLLNFAQGEMSMFSTFIAWSLIQAGAGYWLAFVATVAISFVMGMAIERLIVRPISSAPHLSIVVVFIGLLLIFNSLAGWIWNYDVRDFPSPFPEDWNLGVYISAHEAGSMAVTALMLLSVYCFFRFTSLGLSMRATAQNLRSSRLVGVRVDLMLSLGWGMAAAIGAVAGMMVAHVLFLEPNMMAGVLIYGFAGAILGGINNPWGAVLGGLIVGVLENLLGAYLIGNELKLTFALVIIIAVLTIKPSGLFGTHFVRRV